METTREPYEALVRWIPAGLPENQYAGTFQAQLNFAFVTRDGDTVVSWTPDPKGPFPVAVSGENGIALGDFIPSLNAAALVRVAELTAAIAEMEAASAAATAEHTAAIAEKEAACAAAASERDAAQDALAAAQQQIAALQAQIVDLTPPPAPAIPPVSRMQALLALHDAGLLDQVNAIVAQSDPRTRLAWETATDFHRTSPTIAALWAALGKSEAELDALFAAAKQIEV